MCSSSGGAQEKGKMGETQFGTKNGAFLSFTPFEGYCTFLQVFKKSHTRF
jgi:hypothetical protein